MKPLITLVLSAAVCCLLAWVVLADASKDEKAGQQASLPTKAVVEPVLESVASADGKTPAVQDKQAPAEPHVHGPKGEHKPVPGPFKFPKEITPTAQQESKRDALMARFAPRREALDEALHEVYSAEQQAQMRAARDAAHAAGKKGKQAHEAVAAAVTLSPEQQARLDQIAQQRKALDDEIRAEMFKLLTPAQLALAHKGPEKDEHEDKEHPQHAGPKGPAEAHRPPPHEQMLAEIRLLKELIEARIGRQGDPSDSARDGEEGKPKGPHHEQVLRELRALRALLENNAGAQEAEVERRAD
jgi:hypothetical protein